MVDSPAVSCFHLDLAAWGGDWQYVILTSAVCLNNNKWCPIFSCPVWGWAVCDHDISVPQQ